MLKKRYMPLIIIVFLYSNSFYANETALKTTIQQRVKNAIKVTTAAALALTAHYGLEFISTFAHEHGHGVGSGVEYTSKMIPTKNIFAPWQGITHYHTEPKNYFFETLAGPSVGISTTYAQGALLKTLQEYIQYKKPLGLSIYEGLKFPFRFFTDAIKTGKQYTSFMINAQSNNNPLNKKTFMDLTLDFLLFLRMGRIIGESTYGLLPYQFKEGVTRGDGEKIWSMLLGDKSKLFEFGGNLTHITIGIMSIPYFIGAGQAIYEKIKSAVAETQ